ncbi:FtsX-like permease family protein [Bacillus massiliigorillae]|uniref:FtsX-like permease family protein n=1 Tax=Bacillus massiliigorillae TaxID=1243664 RepID=UPI0003A42F90|nr:FtsX-like permease family protein [Bacillus massiliigorillae]
MSFVKLSFMNVKQNLKNYGMYIFSMVFSIIVFYNFLTLCFSDQFRSISNVQMISAIAILCIYVLTLFFIFFISYSSKFFVEQRKKEFGIYTFMGIENSKIAAIFTFEGLLVGLIALISGLIGGIIVNKLFLMVLVKLAHIDKVMKFEINVWSMVITGAVFGVILLIVSIKEYFSLVRTDITKLLNATKSYQVDLTKNKTVAGLSGLVIIIFSYFLILKYNDLHINFMIAIFATVTFIIIGTGLLFKGFFSFYLSRKVKNKKFLYKNSNIVTYNNIVFRVRDNNKSLGAVAVLITCCLTSIIVSTSMRELFINAYEDQVPYSVAYVSENEGDDEIIQKAIQESGQNIDFKVAANLIPYEAKLHAYINEASFVKYSEVEKVLNKRDIKFKGRIIKNKPTEGLAMVIFPGNLVGGFSLEEHLKVGKTKLQITDTFSSPLLGNVMQETLIIVNDKDFESIQKTLSDTPIIKYRGITLKDFDKTKQISAYVKEHSKINMFSADMFDKEEYDSISTVYFLGFFVALVFLLSIGSIMYFKCIADAMKDKEKFDVLRKIGTDEAFIKKTVYKQVAIFFMLPIIVGVLHSFVAGYAVTDLLYLEGNFVSLISVIGFTILYVFYYLLTVRKYLSITQ